MELSERQVDDVQILQLSGRFDAGAAGRVKKWIGIHSGTPPAHLVVNLEKVTFIDSTGLATLVQGMKRSRQQGGDLLLCRLEQPVRLVFELTRLDRAFEVLPTEEDAIAAFNGQKREQEAA